MKTPTIAGFLLLGGFCVMFPACGKSAPSQGPGASPREALIKAVSAMYDAKSYRFKLVQTGSMGLDLGMEGEYAAPDRYRTIGEGSLDGSGSGRQEIVAIGEQTFVKSPLGKWERMESKRQRTSLDSLRDRILVVRFTNAKDADIRFIGKEDLDGRPVFVYEHSVPTSGVENRIKVWVGVQDSFPYKTEMVVGLSLSGRIMRATTTTTYSDYNAESIRIVAPM
ncbi:MAG TPA: hypothetical protein VJH03_00320 [Blastocatellia bacterium]|nr:hypothetical protein [Blastocatellia bacterium]